MRNFAFLFFFLIIELSVSDPHLFAFNENTNKWIQNNPNPSKNELLAFVETYYYSSINNVDDSYKFFYTILKQYPPSLIHHLVYVYFAEIAMLRYDFQNAALLYYSVFEITSDSQYLLLAGIQEYQSGNISLAKRNITILEENYDTSQYILTLMELKTAIFIYEKKFNIALEYLKNTITKNSSYLFPASIYYMLYKVATKVNDEVGQEFSLSKLKSTYPRSPEYKLIANSITALPIPSHFFSFLDTIDQGSLNALSSQRVSISSVPLIGYQVSSFQSRQRAENYYHKLIQQLKSAKYAGEAPVMSKLIVENITFYQVIIPLTEDVDTQAQIQELREIGIEGFLKN